MNQKYTVIDNFLNQADFEKLRDLMMSCSFSWYFQDEMTYVGKKSVNDEFYFTHIFYVDHQPNSAHYKELAPLVQKINPNALIRIKGNMYPNIGTFLENEKHTDYEFENKGAVFSINTCNGFTRLEDGTKIDSVANRLLIFDGTSLHNSTHCTDEQRRVNININYV